MFLETVDEALRNREYTDFNDGLNSKVKLSLYKSLCKEIELLRRSRYTIDGLNKELGRHRGDRQCKVCGDECESVVHVLWECPVHVYENTFMGESDKLLGGGGGGGGGVLRSLVHLIILIGQALF